MEVSGDDLERDDGRLLKEIIDAVDNADFVALDLEFSGVQRNVNTQGRRQTVRERYIQLREAAHKYQVLQLGLCIATFDDENDAYVLRPYTFPVSLVTDPKWGIEREHVFQASAIQFLSDNGFDFNLLFQKGIRYLSNEEEKYVREKEECALAGVLEDIHVEEAQAEFLHGATDTLQKWVEDSNPKFDFVNITGPGGEINAYQKRLVHQLVRAKFPELVTQSRYNFVQVIKRSPIQKAAQLKERRERSAKNINKGVGLRYVIDALRKCQVPLVGHNVFGDLIHLYQCFVGQLPGTIKEFLAMVHQDFPVVCDTKYIATCEGLCSSAASSLQVLSDTLKGLCHPRITLHHDHLRRANVYHDAGYDSLVTAQVLIKLIVTYQHHLERQGDGQNAEQNAREAMAGFVNQMGRMGEIPALDNDHHYVPEFTSYLWNGFKNRLRVNGTEEGIVVLEEEEGGGVKLEGIDI